MKKRILLYFVCLTAIVFLLNSYTQYLLELAKYKNILNYEETKEKIRAQDLTLEMVEQWKKWGDDEAISWYDYMCTYFITGIKKQKELERYYKVLQESNPEEYKELHTYLVSIWEDLIYFPIPISLDGEEDITYENSWMYERTFGGTRGHEGTDLMAVRNVRGIYPILSVSDGVVEKIGWLPKGGYRIGIRSKNGAYFYYAHLYDYAKDFQPGDEIHAGDFLGFMGDSGYSEVEGTVGMFDVHLHLGIYVNQPNGEEMSINPYWAARYLEKYKIKYDFD